VLAGYSHIYLTTGFRQPEAVRLYLSQGYDAQFDLARNPESTASRRLMGDCASLKRWR
jgi:hypothetical protein